MTEKAIQFEAKSQLPAKLLLVHRPDLQDSNSLSLPAWRILSGEISAVKNELFRQLHADEEMQRPLRLRQMPNRTLLQPRLPGIALA